MAKRIDVKMINKVSSELQAGRREEETASSFKKAFNQMIGSHLCAGSNSSFDSKCIDIY